jgi:hypothetical protein
MRPRSHRVVALALAGALALPRAGFAQEPGAPAGAGLAGSWEGWAKLANDWPGLACRYEGGPDATSVRLELGAEAGPLKGSVALDLTAAPGSGCPPLRKRYAIAETVQGPGTLSFTDSGGNEWTLAVRRNGTVLQGLLAWRQGGAEQALARASGSGGAPDDASAARGPAAARRRGHTGERRRRRVERAPAPSAGPPSLGTSESSSV